MKGYTGFKFGEAKPYDPFTSGASTFRFPSYLSSFYNLLTPEEQASQGSIYAQNPQLLEKRAQLEQIGRQRQFDIAKMGDPTQAGKRAYSIKKERDELERLRQQDEIERLKMERDQRMANSIKLERLKTEAIQAKKAPQYAPLAGGEPIQTVVRRIPAMPQEIAPMSGEVAQRAVASGGMGAANQLPAPFIPQTASRPLGLSPSGISLTPFGGQQNEFQRAYAFGREEEELGRLRMAAEGRRLQSQMAAQPQMEAIRGGIMGRMAGRLGVNLPTMAQPYQSGTGYTPSWMQNYQTPQFPRY